MSAFVSGLVFRADLKTVNRKMVMLKLADHAHDDGTHIYPSVGLVAAQTHLSERTVQRVLSDLVDEGLLILVSNEFGGRGKARNYQIDLLELTRLTLPEKGDRASPFKWERVSHSPERVTLQASKGDTACHPNHQEPSRKTRAGVRPAADDVEGWLAALPEQVGGPVRLETGSDEYAAWDRWLREKRGRGAPSPNGEWWFPTRWPPGHVHHEEVAA
jgi:DNA-binding transcriptional ArsR family regulator